MPHRWQVEHVRAAVPADAQLYATYGRFNGFLSALTSDPDEPPNESYPEPFQTVLQCADALGVEPSKMKLEVGTASVIAQSATTHTSSTPPPSSTDRKLRGRSEPSAASSSSASSSLRLRPKPEPKPGTPPGFIYRYSVGDVCKNSSDRNRAVEIIEVSTCM